MADDYSCKRLNSYTDAYGSQDHKSLYIKSIPADLTEDAFVSLFSCGGKKIKNHRLYPAKPEMDVTCGFVNYENENDALESKLRLNNKPPLYLKIDFSEKKKNQSSHQGIPSMHERGRGRQSDSGASGYGHSGISGASGPARRAAIGRGRALHPEPLGLKVKLDGDERTAFYNPKSVDNLKEESMCSLDLPALIPNLCLFCKEKGNLLCEKCRQTYCSRECQRQDWPNHKFVCKSLSTTISKQSQFANDSSYMSEGSSSDNDKKVNLNISDNQHFNRNQNAQAQHITSTKPRGSQASPSKHHMSGRETKSCDNGIQKAFIRANELQKQELSLNKQYKMTVCKSCSPSNFWIHLNGSEKVLYQMEKEMTSVVQKIPVKFSVGDVCCTFENGKFKRVKLLEFTPNSSVVEFIDYGGTSALMSNKLYFLPQEFKKYPVQAICCNLVDGVSQENVIWSDEEISSFEYHTKNKVFMGHVHGFAKNMYNIALMNEEGVSLYSILRASCMEELKAFSQATSPATTVPSVLSDLKEGAKVTVGSVQFEEDKFWGFLDNGSRIKMLKELQNCLQNVKTEDISLTCEEGDIAVGFSNTLSQFYRCVVLKRLRNSFLVRYIDYGNTEKITKLQSLSPTLLQKKSYAICCEKPVSLSIDDMNHAFETTREVTVKSVNNMAVELSFRYKNSSVVMCCYPWCYGTSIAPLITSHSNVSPSKSPKSAGPKSYMKAAQFPRRKISLDSKQDSMSEIKQKVVITKDQVPDKKLDAALKHDVKIVWIKDASEIYVQLIADEDAISKLLVGINQHCNSEPYSAYSPIVDEIVCCKFSDGVWYRAQVIGKNKNMYKVFFIDYGNETEVSINDIKPLHEKFACPKLSCGVSLYGIKNEDLNKELLDKLMEEKWSMEVKNLQKTITEVMFYLRGVPLTELAQKTKKLSKTLLQFQELPVGTSEVVVCYAQADKIYVHQQKDLENLLMLQTKMDSLVKMDVSKPEIGMVYCCLSVDGCWYRGFVKEILTKTVQVIYIDYGNQEEILIDNLKVLSDDLFSHPVYCVPLIVQNLKLSELKLEAVFSVEVVGKKGRFQLVNVLNSPPNVKPPKISDLDRLSLKEGINEVKLSFCENDIFYCHLKNNFADIDILSQKLMKLELKPLNQIPTKDDLVCAKSSDGCWYRASVQSTFDKDLKLKVFFIDYGNCEDVPSENIQCLPEDMLKFPVLCVPVKIKNIEKAKNDIDMNSILSFKTVGFSDKVQLVELVFPCKPILPKSNSLKKQSLPLDKKVDVSLCHAEGDILFVQMASSKELLTTIETKLLKASEFADLPHMPVIGDVICAKFIDGIWYRGSVEKVFTDKKSCDICFIDYGNNEVISLENMKILPTSLCTFPVLSIPVKFISMEKLQEKIQASISIFPVRVIESSDAIFVVDIVVPEEDIQLPSIESEMLPESPVEVMVVHKEGDVFYVQRISNAEKLQEMMIDLQSPSFLKKLLRNPKVGELFNVKYEDGQFYRAIIKEQCDENKFKAFFLDYGNLDIVELENIYCIPSKYSSVPGLCTAVKFNEPENAKVLNSNPMCTIKYTGISKDNVHVVKLFPAVSRIPISSMKQSNLETGVHDITFLSFDGEFYFLSKISDSVEMNEMCSILEKFEGNEISDIPKVDEVLIVKSQNHSWCRGCIKDVNETSRTCKVFLIDYGTTEDVPFTDISCMSEKLSAFPIFCIKVILKDSSSKAVLLEKRYSASVIGKNEDGVPVIDIFKRYMLASIVQQKLPLNELRNVVFYHKEGDILFLQDVNDFSLIAEVQEEVKKIASSDPLFCNPVVGELLCARSQADGSWYRCCVEELVSSDKCRIRFIDYGNDEIVMRDSLRSFVGELAMYPSFAIPVRIVDNDCAKSTIQFEHVYSVIAESLENNIQLVKLMLQHDSANQISSEDIPLNNNASDSKTKETCLKPSVSENNIVNETCTSTSLSPEIKFFYSTSDYVHFPDGEQDILIYSVNEECSLFCALFSSDAITANLGLTSEITQYCENLETSSFNGNSPPEVDELVLAKYAADNQWYRAVILDDSNYPFYDVIFIDYGNSERVSIDFIRKMEKNFMSLPIQAHLCSITGFTIDDDEYLPDVIQELQSFGVFVNPAPLKAFISSNEEDKSVNIPLITEHLLKKKLVTAL